MVQDTKTARQQEVDQMRQDALVSDAQSCGRDVATFALSALSRHLMHRTPAAHGYGDIELKSLEERDAFEREMRHAFFEVIEENVRKR